MGSRLFIILKLVREWYRHGFIKCAANIELGSIVSAGMDQKIMLN